MNCEELKTEIYRFLDIIRVYTKMPGREADLSEPVICYQLLDCAISRPL
jgi:ribosome-interacting GTPase 1